MRRTVALLAILLLVPGCIGEDPRTQAPTGADQPAEPQDTDQDQDQTSRAGWPSLDEAKLRPGMPIGEFTAATGETWPSCTANFVFRTSDNDTLYVGTAAHCVDDLDRGDPVSLAEGVAVARLAYSSWNTSGDEPWEGENFHNDFALLRVEDEYRDLVHPAILHFGGPTGIAPAPDPGDRLWTYGNTEYREAAPQTDRLDPREGIVEDSRSKSTYAYLPGTVPGDSGSPVMTADGAALGTMSTLNRVWTQRLPDTPPPGSNSVSNLGYALDYLHANTDLRVELVTWEILEPGVLPQPS